jgi:ABC-2 type transport system permease protein
MYRIFLAQYIKTLIEYRADFMIGIFSFIFTQFAGILFLYLVFEQIPSFNGWEFNEILFIYGFFQIPRGIDHLFTDNIWLIPNKVRQGEMDRYLVRPINEFFHLVAERFQPEAIGELVLGIGILIYVVPQVELVMTPFDIIYIILFVLIGAWVYTSIKLIMASVSFWIKDSMPLISFVYDTAEFVKYPLSIYPKWIQIIVTYIIPFAFTAYFPGAYLLGYEPNALSLLVQAFVTTLVIWLIAYRVWKIGLANYTSAGS